MTTTELTELLKNPSQLNSLSYESLDNLLLQFPYCNSIRMLLLKKYKNDKHIAFERHLALASMYATDRGKLYEFLNAAVVSNATSSTTLDVNPSEEKKTKLATLLIEPPAIYHCKISDNPPVLAFQKPLTIEELSLGEPNTDNSEHIEDDRSLSTMPIEEWLQDFEPPRIEDKDKGAAYKKGFKLSRIPVFEKSMFDFLEEDAEEQRPEPQKSKSQKTKTTKTKTSKKPSEDTDLLKEEVKLLEEVKPVLVEEPNNVFEDLETIDEDDALVFQNLDKIYKDNSSTTDIFDLFLTQTDGFLKSIHDKKETKEHKDYDDPWEDDSISENEEVVSETLADILAKQGQKDKAIKMYETLSLNFPKKSRLFADKIAKLRS